MIITTEKSSTVISNSDAQVTSFKIKAGAKAFKILSSFYSDPILAIPRELGANAWDSHVASKNPKPFLVHAPNSIEPWFSVRDYGLGLSAQDVVNVYTTYFESTKTDANDYDGCMGLGSKTPFNYTDNFTVTSWFYKKKYVYNCFVSEQSIPSIMLMAEENTNEPNGVEVKLAVKQEDISKFIQAITQAYSTFRHKPIIVGHKIEYPENKHKYTAKNSRWAIRETADRYRDNVLYAYMGNYRYRVDMNSISRQLSDENRKNFSHVTGLLSSQAIDLYFDIGDLDVAPNKEELQYDVNEKTSLAVLELGMTIAPEIRDYVQTQISTPTSLWDAMGLYHKYFSYNSSFYFLVRLLDDAGVMYNGKKIAFSKTNFYDIGCALKLDPDYASKISSRNYMFDSRHADWKTHRIENNKLNVGSDYKEILFFYTNKQSIQHNRIKHYIRSNNKDGKNYYVFIDNSANFDLAHKYKNYLGLTDTRFINIDTLSKAPRTSSPAKKIDLGKTTCWTIHSSSLKGYATTDRIDLHNIDAAKTYYYMDFSNTTAFYKNTEITTEKKVVDLLCSAHTIGALKTGDVVYKIMRRNIKFLSKNFINVCDVITNYIEKNRHSLEYNQYLDNFVRPIQYSTACKVMYPLISNKKFINQIKNKSTIAFFTNLSNKFEVIYSKHICSISYIYETLKIKPTLKFTLADELIEAINAVNEKYLKIFDLLASYYNNSYSNEDFYNAVANIINFVDEKTP